MTTDADNVTWWMRLALGDLIGAKAVLTATEVPPREAAFMAHQAAEKGLKAAILATGTEPPWTHDLVGLRQRAPEVVRAATLHLSIEELSAAAVGARYPDPDDPPYNHDDVEKFVAIASEIIDVARAYLVTTGVDPMATEPA